MGNSTIYTQFEFQISIVMTAKLCECFVSWLSIFIQSDNSSKQTTTCRICRYVCGSAP